jgi:hypothetical protein
MPQYSEEQRADILVREEKARVALKELQLNPACMPQLVNLGDDTFGIKLFPYLADSKFSSQKSPIQSDELSKENK